MYYSQVVYAAEDHTAENINLMIDDVFRDWELKQECQTAITTDNGSNIVKAVKDKGNKPQINISFSIGLGFIMENLLVFCKFYLVTLANPLFSASVAMA